MPLPDDLRRLLRGPAPALPARLDALAERWAAAGPRARLAVVAGAVLLAALLGGARAAASPWGPARPVLVAARDLPVGAVVASGDLAVVPWPARVAPPDALADAAALVGRPLSVGAAAGTPLTAAHADGGGLADLLAAGEVALPVPLPSSGALAAGAVVDVYGGDAGTLLAADARVLAVEQDLAWLALPRTAAGAVAAAARWDQVALAVRGAGTLAR